MALFHLSFDLNREAANYNAKHAKVTETIRQMQYLHLMGSTYVVSTNASADQIVAAIGQHLDGNDRLLVTAITSAHRSVVDGWLTPGERQWMFGS